MTYRVVVTREGRNWLADVPEVQGAHTYADSLSKLDRYVREVISLALDLPEGEGVETGLDLTYEYHLGQDNLDEITVSLRTERARLDAAERELANRTAQVAQDLRRLGLSARDAAALLGVSHQRVLQVTPRHAA